MAHYVAQNCSLRHSLSNWFLSETNDCESINLLLGFVFEWLGNGEYHFINPGKLHSLLTITEPLPQVSIVFLVLQASLV